MDIFLQKKFLIQKMTHDSLQEDELSARGQKDIPPRMEIVGVVWIMGTTTKMGEELWPHRKKNRYLFEGKMDTWKKIWGADTVIVLDLGITMGVGTIM